MEYKKFFIITIDTESDNQWDTMHCQTTENAKYIPRFQELCEKYSFKPVYLIDYSMGQDEFLIDFLKDCNKKRTCEIGMHLHAWDTPPRHEYDTAGDARPFLVEYPTDVMRQKIESIHTLLTHNFECEIITHRAGRWIINSEYIRILSEFGYKVDCSITPGINWERSRGVVRGGVDYSKEEDSASWFENVPLMEVPMTIKKVHKMMKPGSIVDFIKEPVKLIYGRYWWLRPALSTSEMMMEVLSGRTQDYAEFMMHSSEMMPGGSPYFKPKEDIEQMYKNLERFFAFVSENYKGSTLREYYTLHEHNLTH